MCHGVFAELFGLSNELSMDRPRSVRLISQDICHVAFTHKSQDKECQGPDNSYAQACPPLGFVMGIVTGYGNDIAGPHVSVMQNVL